MCVGGQYLLTIRSSSPDSSEQSVLTRIISVADPPVTISYVVDRSIVSNFNVCTNNYSFEIAVAVNTKTTNQLDGEFNYGGKHVNASVYYDVVTVSFVRYRKRIF